MKSAPGEASEELLAPVKRIAPKTSSSNIVVTGVLPEFGSVPEPVAVWIWSRGEGAARPENLLAEACAPLLVLGNVTVMVSEVVKPTTLCAEQIVRRGEVEVLGMSASIV